MPCYWTHQQHQSLSHWGRVAHICLRDLYHHSLNQCQNIHGDVSKWKHFPCYWPVVRWIHRSPVNSPHKGQWRGALIFSVICAWINGWVNNRVAGDLTPSHSLGRHRNAISKCQSLVFAARRILLPSPQLWFVPSRFQPCLTNLPTVKRPFHVGWFCSRVSVLNNICYRQGVIWFHVNVL